MATRTPILSVVLALVASALLTLVVAPSSVFAGAHDGATVAPAVDQAVTIRTAKPTAIASSLCRNSITYRCPLTCEATHSPVVPGSRTQTTPRDKSVTIADDSYAAWWAVAGAEPSVAGRLRSLLRANRDPAKAPYWAVFAATARMHA